MLAPNAFIIGAVILYGIVWCGFVLCGAVFFSLLCFGAFTLPCGSHVVCCCQTLS